MELTCYYSEAGEKREGGDSGRGVRNGMEGGSFSDACQEWSWSGG